MDEGAFVDSLLAPNMRAASASVVVAAAPSAPPPMAMPMPFAPEFAAPYAGERKRPSNRRRGHHGGMGTTASTVMMQQQQHEQFQPLDDASSMMFGRGGAPSADFDDSLFRQLMGSASGSSFGMGADQDETGSLPPLSTSSARSLQMTLAALASSSSGLSSAKESAVENPPTSTNSLLFEPLELPKGGISAPLDQSFKDAFGAPVAIGGHDGADSPVVSPPNSACSLRSLASVFQGDPCSTPRSPVYSDPSAMMPVQPLSNNGQTYFASSGMATSNGFASNTASFSMSSAPPPFWMGSHSTPNSLIRGMMDGFDSISPPGSMRQMLLMASGIVSPPSSTGSSIVGPFSASSLNASLLAQQHVHQQQQQLEMWAASSNKAQARTIQTPTATTTAKRGKKRARARQTGAPSEQLSILVPSMTPTSGSDKQLVVSAGIHGKNSDVVAANTSGQTTKRARTSRVRSPSTVSPMAMLTPTTSPSGSGSDGDGSSTTRAPKGKKCVEPGCIRRAQSNSRCKAHGGGARCQFAGPGGCSRSSQGGGFCRAHGGGKRCEFPGCVRGQQRKGRCYVHGGIRRCQWAGCEKKDRGNGFCISHGGGKRCEREGCARAVRRGNLCQLHDGSRQEE